MTKSNSQVRARRGNGFTLVETLISMAILGVVFGSTIVFYTTAADRAEWSAHSLAAESIASQGVEQVRAARWDPQAWPQLVGPGCADELGLTNYAQIATLDVPVSGPDILATNYVKVTTVSTNPPIRQIRSDCIWRFKGRGVFTNTVITLRAADQ